MVYWEDISNEAIDLLLEIVGHENEFEYWEERFEHLNHREDVIIRGCFKELKEHDMIQVMWADNYPYHIEILKDGYLLEEEIRKVNADNSVQKNNSSTKEKKMKDYEILLEKLISRANKDDLNILSYSIEPGERPLFGKLEKEGYIKNVHFRGHQYVALDLTYDGLHYFDEEKDTVDENMPIQHRKLYDVFLSHASADKITYVEELKQTLAILGVKVFYDKDTIEWGDNWKKMIYEGLEKSEFAIIVISENFFGREWTELELKSLLERQNEEGQKLILPILHNITTAQLREKYPSVADIQAIESSENSNEKIALLFAKQLIKRYR